MNHLEKLCREKTCLDEADIKILKAVAHSLPLYAEMSGAYMFIDCLHKEHEHALVVAEAFPETEKPLYTQSVLGKPVFEPFEPGVFYSFNEGKKSIITQAVTQQGRSVSQTVIPIRNEKQVIIAVLIEEKEIAQEKKELAESSIVSIAPNIIRTIMTNQEDDLPIVSDVLTELFILTDAKNELIYTNPVGKRFLEEMGRTESIYSRNLGELIPFLKEVYEGEEDVYVYDLTVEHKNLIIKKIRMRSENDQKETLLIIQDLTELRMKEKELSMKSIMIQEIHHRVKNNLQTIASLLRLQMNKGIPKESYDSFEDTLNRIFSISSVYELILANETFDDEEVNIVELTRNICSKMVMNHPFDKIDLIINENSNIILTTQKKAVSIALIINELVQNALKHAFLNRESGEISIDFIVKEAELEVHIADNGVGIDEQMIPSLGLEIVRNLVENDLLGEFTYLDVNLGTHALITFAIGSEVEVYHEKNTHR